jgi:hypothetical protein
VHVHPEGGRSYFGRIARAADQVSEAQPLITELAEKFEQLKKNKELKNVAVRVRKEGNLVRLLGLAEQK